MLATCCAVPTELFRSDKIWRRAVVDRTAGNRQGQGKLRMALRRALGDEHASATPPSGYLNPESVPRSGRAEVRGAVPGRADGAGRPRRVAAAGHRSGCLWRGPEYGGLTGALVEDTATGERAGTTGPRSRAAPRNDAALGRERSTGDTELVRANRLRERLTGVHDEPRLYARARSRRWRLFRS